MTLEEIIELFKEVENDVHGQKIGFHLHRPIRQASNQTWFTNDSYSHTFSGFLTSLKEAEPYK